MKRLKYILLLLFIGCTFQSQSQILLSILFGDKLNSDGLEFGLEGSFNFSEINSLEANKRLSNFNLGFYFDFRIKNQWNIYTGVLVKARLGTSNLSANDLDFLGIESKDEEGDYEQKISYIIVPVLLKYNLKNRIYFEAGPQFGLMYNAYVEFNAETDNRDTRIRDNNEDSINRIDAGFTLGAGYKLRADNGITIGIKYYHGLTNVYKGVSGSNNNSVFLKVNVPIGANKAKKSKDNS